MKLSELLNPIYVFERREYIFPFIRSRANRIAWPSSPLLYLGLKHCCPVCGAFLRKFAMFKPSSSRPGRPAECPFCHSLERTRAIWIWLEMKGLLQGRIRMLHVAPEPSLENEIRKMSNIAYATVDLHMGADVQVDLTNSPLDSDVFDLIYCSNVLEHIEDDASAILELYRMTKPHGLAIIQVPIKGEKTLEDPTITSPEERDRLFGQFDHVRYYGRDVKLRFERAGFQVEECWMPDALGLSERQNERYGVAKRELVHMCYKL